MLVAVHSNAAQAGADLDAAANHGRVAEHNLGARHPAERMAAWVRTVTLRRQSELPWVPLKVVPQAAKRVYRLPIPPKQAATTYYIQVGSVLVGTANFQFHAQELPSPPTMTSPMQRRSPYSRSATP